MTDTLGQPAAEQLSQFGRSRVTEILTLQSEDLFKLVKDQHGRLQPVAAPEDGGLEKLPQTIRCPGSVVDRLGFAGLLASGGEDLQRREGMLCMIEADRQWQQIALAQEREEP